MSPAEAAESIPVIGPSNGAISMDISPDGSVVYAADGNVVRVIDTASQSIVASVSVGNAQDVVISPDGTRAYALSQSCLIYVFDVATSSMINTFDLATPSCRNLDITPNGSTLYVTRSNNIALVSTSTGTVTSTISVAGSPEDVLISADGSLAWVVINQSSLNVYNLTTNTLQSTFPSSRQLYRLGMAPDGTPYVTDYYNPGGVLLIESAGLTSVLSSNGTEQSSIGALGFSADGERLYMQSRDTSVVTVIDRVTFLEMGSFDLWLWGMSIVGAPDGTMYAATNNSFVRLLPPEFDTGTPTTATSGAFYSYFIPLVTEGATPATFALTAGAVPPGIHFSTLTGELRGTPTVSGTFTFTVKATNLIDSVERQYSLTVDPAPAVPPTITTPSVLDGQVGVLYSQTIAATGDNPITFSVASGTLPSGLALDPATGVISGTPTTPGTFTFTVDASNVAGNDQRVYSITVAPVAAVAPTITTPSVPDGQVGVVYSQTIAATGDNPITFSVASGTLPSGLALDPATGVISGTPTTPGTFTFTVDASNVAGNDQRVYSITVAPVAAVAPTITTTSVPGGRVGSTYTQLIEATGDATITFALVAGALPDGLSLNPATGVISGTPTSSGTFTFTVSATNSAGTDEQEYSITLEAGPTPTPAPTPTPESHNTLAFTGQGPSLGWAWAGIALVVIGGSALVIVGRRSRRA